MVEVQPGFNVVMRVTGDPVSVTGESLTDTGHGTRFEVSDLTRSLMDPESSVTVYIDGTDAQTAGEPYVIEYLTGAVVFENDQTGSTITADYDYLPSYYIDFARSTTLNSEYESLEATTYFDTAQTYELGRKTPQLELEHINLDPDKLDGQGGSEPTLRDIMDMGNTTVLEFGPAGTDTATKVGLRQGTLYRMMAKFTQRELAQTLGELQSSSLTAEATIPAVADDAQRLDPLQTREV